MSERDELIEGVQVEVWGEMFAHLRGVGGSSVHLDEKLSLWVNGEAEVDFAEVRMVAREVLEELPAGERERWDVVERMAVAVAVKMSEEGRGAGLAGARHLMSPSEWGVELFGEMFEWGKGKRSRKRRGRK